MKLITSLSVERLHSASGHFWPRPAERLVVVVWQPDSAHDMLLALGVDPDHDRGHGQIVIEAELPSARLSTFIRAVIDGNRGELDRHCHRITIPGSDHHAASDSRHLVAKVSRALAVAIRSEVRLADAVVSSAAHRDLDPEQCK